MQTLLKIVVIIVIMIISTCANAQQQVETIFSDHFDGQRVNSLSWHIPTWRNSWDGTYVGRTQFRCSQNASLPIAENSNAVVNIETYNPTGFSMYGTDMITNRQFSPGKGLIFTVRAKINAPVDRGIVGGIFLYDLTTGTNHDEIDFEMLSNDPKQIHTNIYANEALGTGYPDSTDYGNNSSITDYHIYTIEWLPNKVSWMVDGNIVRTNTSHVPAGPMSFHFNMWAPAQEWMAAFDANLQPTWYRDSNQVFSMFVDYIKIDSLSDNPRLPVSVTIAANQNNICSGEPVTFTATPINGGNNPSCQWKLNGNNVGFLSMTYANANLQNGDVISCVLTSSLGHVTGNPAASNAITMVVNERLPVNVSIVANQNPICSGQSVIFTATPTNGGTDPIYRWKINGVNVGIDSSRYAYTPINGDIVSCEMISSVNCYTNNPATSNKITMGVGQNLTVGISIVADQNNICEGTTVTYTATPVNGGTTPIYQWKVNKNSIETYSNTYSYKPVNGDVVSCTMISSVNCLSGGNVVTSNSITMAVNKKLPVSVSIVVDQNNVCTGTTVTYKATATNGGTNPVFQWKKNGNSVGNNSDSYSYVPANGDVILCTLTSSLACIQNNIATSNTITMVVNQKLTVGINITASANPVCNGSEVKFTSAPVNGGANPIYQWKKNGNSVGNNSDSYSYVPANGDVISCVLTSNTACVIGDRSKKSNDITVMVNNVPVFDKLTGPDTILNTTSATYIVSCIGKVDYYGWLISPSDAAGFVSVEDSIIKIRSNESFKGNCVLNIKAVNGCGEAEAFKNIYIGTPTSVDDIGEVADLSIYPNPSDGVFTISSDEQISEVYLYDINGRVIEKLNYPSQKKVTVDCNNLRKGVYFAHVFMAKGYVVQKLIIN